MKSENERVLSISGSDTIQGGNISKDIKISGNGKIKDDLSCESLIVSGNCQCNGTVNSNSDIQVSGALKINDNCSVRGDLRCSGFLTIKGIADIKGNIKISGKSEFSEEVYVLQNAEINGFANFKENLTVDNNLYVGGKINVSGNIKAYNVDISHHIPIFGIGFLRKIITSVINNNVYARDTLILMDTHVKGNIVAPNIKLLGSCKIDGLIIYSNSLETDPEVELDSDPIRDSPESLGLKLGVNMKTPTLPINMGEPVKFRYCPVCGTEYNPPKHFCVTCGADLS